MSFNIKNNGLNNSNFMTELFQTIQIWYFSFVAYNINAYSTLNSGNMSKCLSLIKLIVSFMYMHD